MAGLEWGLDRWRSSLATLGFTRVPEAPAYSDGVLSVSAERGWLVLTDHAPERRDSWLRSPLGAPALWRHAGENGAGPTRVFELPPGSWNALDDPREREGRFAGLITWASETVDGDPLRCWASPEPEAVRSWIPPGGLTSRTATGIRQGALTHRDDRLALSFPILAGRSVDLDDEAAAWLAALLDEARRTWRLVRIGPGDGDGSPVAEVDLTGAPVDALEDLVRAAVDALRLVVRRLAPVAELVTNPDRRCRALSLLSPGIRHSEPAGSTTSGGTP